MSDLICEGGGMISARELVEHAEREITTLSIEQVLGLHGQEDVLLVDIRDIRELAKTGRIPGALHAPRGMLEFWVDPECEYFREEFSMQPHKPKHFIFFCAAGWRSALATKTVQDMGLKKVSHMEGGFGAWIQAGGAVDHS